MVRYIFLPIRRMTDLKGRSRRREYWLFTLALIVVWFSILAGIHIIYPLPDASPGRRLIEALPPMSESANRFLLYLSTPFLVFLGWVHLALTVRRLHDLGKTGWWYLVLLLPYIGTIWAIVWLVQNGQPFENRFGKDLKGREGMADDLTLRRPNDGVPLPAARVVRD